MFIRTKTTPNSPRKSIQIVESHRDNVTGKVKQKIIRHVGIAMNDKELRRMMDLAEFIKAEIENEHQMTILPPEEMAALAIEYRKNNIENEETLPIDNFKKLREELRIVLGIHEVYGKIYDEIGFQKTLNANREVNATQILQHIVMARIANPNSKRESVNILERDFGVHLQLEKVYRMMDKLDEVVVDRIQQISRSATQKVLAEKINILFYDCTTLYFESFSEDELKQNGYSKDLKFNQPQVILGLLATEDGLPIGYEVFPGATFEGHTLLKILQNLRQRFAIGRIVFAADSGMLNENNLALLEKEGFDYVVGARLRNLSDDLTAQMLDEKNYIGYETENGFNRIAIFSKTKNRNLIVNYSKQRAKKDEYDRKKAIEKLVKKLSKSNADPKSLLNNYGYKKYIAVEGNVRLKINEEKLHAEKQWDGLLGIVTNIKDMEALTILEQYKNLWQIEECFRLQKHDLKIRPIFHWTPRRVRAHIAIAYIAFTCVKHLEYRVKLQYKKMSPEMIRKELLHVQLSILKHKETKEQYAVPSGVSHEVQKIYQVMGTKISVTPFKIK